MDKLSSNVWVTSDWHFCHNKEFLYKPRGFSTVEEMNQKIVQNHNEIVGQDDDVFVLGDLSLNDIFSACVEIKKLNGNLHIILGNHDTERKIDLYSSLSNVVEISYARPLQYNGYSFWLCHFPTLCSEYDSSKFLRKKRIALCGHSHVQDPFYHFINGLVYHCEMDAHKCYPVNLNKVISDIKERLNIEE